MFVVSIPPRVEGDAAKVLRFLMAELQRLTESQTSVDHLNLNPLHAAPLRPSNGMLVYADGTDWNPGSGEGLYGYENGAWVKL